MKQAIVGYSLYFLVVEPRNTLSFKMFDKCLTLIEFHYTVKDISNMLKTFTKKYEKVV